MNSILVVLGGGLVQGADRSWRTLELTDAGDSFAPSNDRWRVLAAAELYKKHPCTIVASGGVGQYKDIPGCPPVSSVVKRELVALGVPADRIVEEARSNNTLEQLKELTGLREVQKAASLRILTSIWHAERVSAMVKYLLPGYFGTHPIQIICAEDVLIGADPGTWLRRVARAQADPRMAKRIALEKHGVRDIIARTYGTRQDS